MGCQDSLSRPENTVPGVGTCLRHNEVKGVEDQRIVTGQHDQKVEKVLAFVIEITEVNRNALRRVRVGDGKKCLGDGTTRQFSTVVKIRPDDLKRIAPLGLG